MPHFCGLPAIRFAARSLRAPTPAKAARGARTWAQRRRQPWTTDGAAGVPRAHFQSWAYPIWDLKGHLKGLKAGARMRAEWGGSPTAVSAYIRFAFMRQVHTYVFSSRAAIIYICKIRIMVA